LLKLTPWYWHTDPWSIALIEAVDYQNLKIEEGVNIARMACRICRCKTDDVLAMLIP
jgi:hypothetical protein